MVVVALGLRSHFGEVGSLRHLYGFQVSGVRFQV